MELRGPDAVVTDPFLAAVRRRHPDVDLVQLPPEAPPSDPPAPVDADTVAEVRDLVRDFAAELWRAVTPLRTAAPEARTRFGATEGDVVATARVVDRRADGFEVLVRLRGELEGRGWAVHRPPGGLERIAANLDDGTVTASYAEASGALVLEVVSADLPVGVEVARELVR